MPCFRNELFGAKSSDKAMGQSCKHLPIAYNHTGQKKKRKSVFTKNVFFIFFLSLKKNQLKDPGKLKTYGHVRVQKNNNLQESRFLVMSKMVLMQI